MMKESTCPVHVVEHGRRLATQIEVRDLSPDFEPADLSWDDNVLRIAREYTNYKNLSRQLQDWLIQAWKEGNVPCEHCATESDGGIELDSLVRQSLDQDQDLL